MKLSALERANQLATLMKVTEEGIRELRDLIVKAEKERKKSPETKTKNFDGMYNLCICEWNDGSGKKAYMPRYEGNYEVAIAVLATLEEQLTRFKAEFEAL